VGDVYLYPTNMGNAEQLLKQPETEPITQQPIPSAEDAAPTQQERNLLGELTNAYIRVFRDGVERVSTRDQRDLERISTIFEPTLRSIADEAERQAAGQFGLDADWHGGLEELVREHLKSMPKRAEKWTNDGVDDFASTELRKAVRSISLSIFREAGARVALKGSNE
jgi:hypothetical protein